MDRRQFMKVLIGTGVTISGITGAVTPRTAQAQSSVLTAGPSGGTGGTSFNDTIPTPGQVVQVHVRSGYRIDGIQIVNTFPNGRRFDQRWRGGNGGTLHTIELDQDEYLIAMAGTIGTKGKSSLRVFSLTFQTNKRTSPEYGCRGSTPFVYQAPPGFEIAGLFGRAGKEIDAIGVMFRQITLS